MITLTDDSLSILAEIRADAFDVDLEHDTAMEMADRDHIDVEADIAAQAAAREAAWLAMPIDLEPW